MAATLKVYSSSIVTLGNFNPAIFSPDWLHRNNLIGKDDTNTAKEQKSLTITNQIAVIETDWFWLQVLQNQFSLESRKTVDPRLRDLVAGILTLVPQTPITAVGLNFSGHYQLSNRDEYHKIGDVLAPKKIWEQVFPKKNQEADSGKTQSIGLANLALKIQPCKRDEIPPTKDEKNIFIQASNIISSNGILLTLNNHRDVSKQTEDDLTSAERVARIISNDWESCNKESEEIFKHILSLVLAE